MNNEDGNEVAKSKGVINYMPKMETVNKTLIGFTKETSDNLKIFIDPVKYQSAVKIDKRISDQPERHLQVSATRSVVGENQGGKIDEHSNISGESTPRNENRENVKLVIDGDNYQFSRKDQKIPCGESKKPAEFVAARTGEVLSQSENSKGNNNVEGSNAAGGSINDLEKYNLEVEKTWITVNNQKSSNESNRESTGPKSQQESLSDKTIGNINKAEAEKFAGNSDKDDSTKKNNYENNEKPVKGAELAETVKINKTTGETTHEYTITNISKKKALPAANIHFSNDQKTEIDKTIESQLVASRQSDMKNSEISAQTKTFPKNDRYFQSSILSQLIDKTSVSLKNGLSSMEIRLKPETLGSLKMLVSNENNQVSIKIVTEGQLVKEIIENNILQLKNELQSQGMEVAKIEVVADHDQSNNRANYGHSKSAPFANKKDNESQQDNMEKLDMDHEDDSNEGPISFFAWIWSYHNGN
jgi:flagellar hook-length control protein FliK